MCVPATLFKKHFNHVESFGLIQLFAWYIITAWYGTRLAMTVNVVCLQSLYNMALKVCVWSQRESGIEELFCLLVCHSITS